MGAYFDHHFLSGTALFDLQLDGIEEPGVPVVAPVGVASSVAFGTTTVAAIGSASVQPTGIASGEAFGTAAISTASGSVVAPEGIGSIEQFGTATVQSSSLSPELPPLVVEDGTGRADSDSYASFEFANSYHTKRGNTAWMAEPAGERVVALRKATTYIDAAYVWRGTRASATQSLAWPRIGVCREGFSIPSNAVPIDLQRAVCELALKALSTELMPDVAPDVVTQESVGPVSVSYGQARNGGLTRFSLVDAMLRGLTLAGGAGGSVRLVRA
jgi:hypothetical protein